MSEIAGLKTNTTHSIGGNVKGLGAQALGFDPGQKDAQPMVDENGFPLASAPQRGYWSNALFTGLDNQPHIIPSIGFQAFRGSNTIIDGAKGGPNNTFQRFNPRNWNRYSSEKIFQPELSKAARQGEKGVFKTISDRVRHVDGEAISDFWKKDKPGYSPFQLSDQIDSIGRKMLDGAEGKLTGKIWRGADYKRARVADEFGGATIRSGSRGTETLKQVQRDSTRASSWLEEKGILARKEGGEVEKLFGRGTMSHMLASNRLVMGGSKPVGETTATNLNKALKATKGSEGVFNAGMTSREAGIRYGAETATGTIGSRIAGHGMGARYGSEVLGQGGNEIFEGAAKNAMKNLELGGISKVEGTSARELLGGFKTAYQSGAAEAASTGGGSLGKLASEWDLRRIITGQKPWDNVPIMGDGPGMQTKGEMDAIKKKIWEKLQGKSAETVEGTVTRESMETAGKTVAREAAEATGKEVAGTAAKTVGKEAAEVAVKSVAKEGAEMAGKAIVKEGVAAAGKYGASMIAGFFSGPVGWIADIAMTAWMAYDIAKLGVNLAKEMVVKPVTNFVKDGFKSYKGQLDKAPMGMGFKDNSVAMTSRQRGVMAISNSRLNARSVLGNEAAGMAAHFG